MGHLKSGSYLLDDSVTASAWATEWLSVYKTSKEHNTFKGYETNIRIHINPQIGTLKLKDVRSHHVQKIVNSLVAEGKIEASRKVYNTMRQIFEKAVDESLVVKSPCKGIELPKLQKPKKRALSSAEKEIILNADFNEKQRAFVFTLLFSGLRREEILTLTKADIDMKKGAISVNKALAFVGNRPEIKPPKSQAGNRFIPIPDTLKDVLFPYLNTLDGLIVFPSAQGEIMTKIAYKRFWDTIIRRINLSAGGNSSLKVIANDISAHLFRHTYIPQRH